jgi:hypothetical protein
MFVRAVSVLFLVLLRPTASPGADGKPLSITVAADRTKANGEPWDGIPGLGGGRGPTAIPVPNTNAPPDLAICIVRVGSPPDCSMRYEGAKQFSLCQNSYDCTFRRVGVPDGPFGLIIIDLDLQRHDLVDAVILTTSKALTSDERSKLESETRIGADRLAPAFSEGEKQRRLRELLVLPMDRCMGAKGCRLVQSEIRLNMAE